MRNWNTKMTNPRFLIKIIAILGIPLSSVCNGQWNPSALQLQQLLKKFPAADVNGDGKLTRDEAVAFRNKRSKSGKPGIQRDFKVDPGWALNRFPEDAVCYKTPAEIKSTFEKATSGKQPAVVSFPKPSGGVQRVIGVGHSFMMPGYQTLPEIARCAGMKQPLYTHVGGGMTGSARYKWEQENGIFEFAGKPFPKLLSSIANAQWEAMTFGPYYNDRPEYYSCWIDFCLKYNPDMKFFISDAWPQLEQLGTKPKFEADLTADIFDQLGTEKREIARTTLDPLRKAYPGRVFVMPTSDALVLAAKHFIRGELPGIDGLHKSIGGKERSLWKDHLGHLGPGLEWLEGYVFYATLYGQSPEHIDGAIKINGNASFPSTELDRMFRKIAWQAVIQHPYSGVTDKDSDGIDDSPNFPAR